MENKEVIHLLKECGSLLDGHFLLTSGKHSNRYCQCAQLLQYPDKAAKVTKFIVDQLKDVPCQVVVGPAMGGIVIGYELARQLGARSLFTERVDNVMTFRRNFQIQPGEKVIISEDVITTGKSTLETAAAIEAIGGEVIGLACIVDRRSPDAATLPFPIYSATELAVQTFSADDCPLCDEKIPLIQPGSRKMK